MKIAIDNRPDKDPHRIDYEQNLHNQRLGRQTFLKYHIYIV